MQKLLTGIWVSTLTRGNMQASTPCVKHAELEEDDELEPEKVEQ